MFDGWTETVVRNIEIDERAAHEDARRMYLLVESVLAIDEEDLEALPREESRTLQSGKAGADDSHVIIRAHRRHLMPLPTLPSSTLRRKDGHR